MGPSGEGTVWDSAFPRDVTNGNRLAQTPGRIGFRRAAGDGSGAQISVANLGIGPQGNGVIGQDDPAGFEDVAGAGDLEGQVGILLNQQDGEITAPVQFKDLVEDRLDQEGRDPQ